MIKETSPSFVRQSEYSHRVMGKFVSLPMIKEAQSRFKSRFILKSLA